MFVFGYVLVHAPIQWNLRIHEYSDVSQLVNACKGSCNIGSILLLIIQNFYSPCSLSKFEELPALLLQVSELFITSTILAPTKWMLSLHNLSILYLGNFRSLEDSPLFYRAIGSYSKLRTFQITISADTPTNEIKALSESIASSRTLEDVKLCHEIKGPVPYVELCGLVEAALSCSTLQTFSTDIPFSAFSGAVSPNLKSITFQHSNDSVWAPKALFDCLCCIADQCKMPSMRSFKIDHFSRDFYPVADKFLVILNHSLHCNPSFTDLELVNLHLSSNYQRGPFSTALRTHPSLLSWNRSKSLSDLSTACAASESGNHNLATDCMFYAHVTDTLKSLVFPQLVSGPGVSLALTCCRCSPCITCTLCCVQGSEH